MFGDEGDCVKGTSTFYDVPSISSSEQKDIICVAEKINQGTLISEARANDYHNIRTIKPLYDPKKVQTVRSCTTIRKIVYPEEEKRVKCHHTGHSTPNRDDITRSDHINLLARPRPQMLKRNKWPIIVNKQIECASHRIAQLAQPNKYKLMGTYEKFQKVLDPVHAENINAALHNVEFVSISQAVEYYMQRKKMEKCKRIKRRRQLKLLKRKFRRMKYKYLVIVMKNIFESMKTYLLNPLQVELTPDIIQISNKILVRICNFMKVPVKLRTGKENQDHFFIQLSDKLAIWATTFATNANYFTPPDDKRKPEDMGSDWETKYTDVFPIEAYSEISTDDYTEEEDDYTQVTESTMYAEYEETEADNDNEK